MNADHFIKCFVRSILAGLSIGLGGCVFLGTLGIDGGSYKWVGAILFTIGLFCVFTFGFDLYTGKVGYVVDNKPDYLLDILVIFLGNLVGCAITGYMMPDSVFAVSVQSVMVDTKLTDPDYLRVFFKGIFCGIMMFVAADYYKTRKSYLGAFICVPVFILAGFEHSIADMFYFFCAGVVSVDATVFIIVVALGNAVGGMLIPFCRKYMYETPAAPAQ